MKKMTAAVLAALLMSPLGTSFYAACEAASTDLRVSSASSQPLPPSPPPDGMPRKECRRKGEWAASIHRKR